MKLSNIPLPIEETFEETLTSIFPLKFAGFKDRLHSSKSQHSVYSVACACGTWYIGKSTWNLKICIHKHTLQSTKSTISLHVKESDAEEDHSSLHASTLIIAQERNQRKWKFMESVCIMAKAPHLCNLEPSVKVSDQWNPNLMLIAQALLALD